MSDIKALQILTDQIENFKQLPKPPESIDDAERYRKALETKVNEAQNAVLQVKRYTERIEEKLQELRLAQKSIISANSDAIQNIIEKLNPYKSFVGNVKRQKERREYTSNESYMKSSQERLSDESKTYTSTESNENVRSKGLLKNLELAHELEKITQDALNNKLFELLQETETACAKVKAGSSLSSADLESLKSCVHDWKDAQEADDRKQREEEKEARRKAEREKAEAEQKEIEAREAEERKRREKRARKAEEERKQKEEERKAKEQKRKREEELKKQREEEKRKAEEEQKEAEERARRLNPDSWKPLTIFREEVAGRKADNDNRYHDEVAGKKAYHGDITCVVLSPSNSITEDDIECNYSDEVDSFIEKLEIGERPLGSLVIIKSRKGVIQTEVPSRIYIPHNTTTKVGDEILIRFSINGHDWTTTEPLSATDNMAKEKIRAKGLAGIEVNGFNNLKVVVTARQKCQGLIVDDPSVDATSSLGERVKIIVPRNTFPAKTEVSFSVQATTDETLNAFKRENCSLENIMSVNVFITINCANCPEKAIECNIEKVYNISRHSQPSKTYRLYATKDNDWKHADVENNENSSDVKISLPKGTERHTIMELDVSHRFPRDSVPKLAETLCKCINSIIVRLILKQHKDNQRKCVLMVIKDEEVKGAIEDLAQCGYTQGPQPSAKFNVVEGQLLGIKAVGYIETSEGAEKEHQYHYLSYLGGIVTDLTLRVKDNWQQMTLQAYRGMLRCILYQEDCSSDNIPTRTVDLMVSLPKNETPRTSIEVARVNFPYYLTSLTHFLVKYCDSRKWKDVLETLLGTIMFQSSYRIATRKANDKSDGHICRAMLIDWMKNQSVTADKISPIVDALKQTGHESLADQCEKFVDFQKEKLSDDVLSSLAEKVTKDACTFGKYLSISEDLINMCIEENQYSEKGQIIAVLKEWRETDGAFELMFDAFDYLKRVCV